jgi:antitoxin VapB
MLQQERTTSLHVKDPEAEALAADVRAIADRVAAHIKVPCLDHAEFLFDEHGLPK